MGESAEGPPSSGLNFVSVGGGGVVQALWIVYARRCIDPATTGALERSRIRRAFMNGLKAMRDLERSLLTAGVDAAYADQARKNIDIDLAAINAMVTMDYGHPT